MPKNYKQLIIKVLISQNQHTNQKREMGLTRFLGKV